jgi:putative tricarboxylic transport membrane protein
MSSVGSKTARSGRRRQWSLLPSLVGLAGGLLYLYGATSYHMGTLSEPGPGMFPMLVAAFVVVPSAVCLVNEYLRPSAPPEGVGPLFWRVPAVAFAILAFILLLIPAGFFPAATVLCLVLLLTLGRRPWWLAVIMATAMALICYLLFQQLNVPLPVGIMPF